MAPAKKSPILQDDQKFTLMKVSQKKRITNILFLNSRETKNCFNVNNNKTTAMLLRCIKIIKSTVLDRLIHRMFANITDRLLNSYITVQFQLIMKSNNWMLRNVLNTMLCWCIQRPNMASIPIMRFHLLFGHVALFRIFSKMRKPSKKGISP